MTMHRWPLLQRRIDPRVGGIVFLLASFLVPQWPIVAGNSLVLARVSGGSEHAYFSEPKDGAVIALDIDQAGGDTAVVFVVDKHAVGPGRWYFGLAEQSEPKKLIAWQHLRRFRDTTTVVFAETLNVAGDTVSFGKDPYYGCLILSRDVVDRVNASRQSNWLVVFGSISRRSRALSNQQDLVRGKSAVPDSVVLDAVTDSVPIRFDFDPPRINSVKISPKWRVTNDTFFVPAGPVRMRWLAKDDTLGAGAIDGCWITLTGANSTRERSGELDREHQNWYSYSDTLDYGTYEVTIVARDTALRASYKDTTAPWRNVRHNGNVGRLGFTLVVGDTVPPRLKLSVPELANSGWSISSKASDARSGLDSVTLQWAYGDTSQWKLLWDTTLTCESSITREVPFSPYSSGMYYFKLSATDCAGNGWELMDSTRYTAAPHVTKFVVLDTTSGFDIDGEHPASPHFANAFVVFDSLCLARPPWDSSSYIEYSSSPDFRVSVRHHWPDADSICLCDTLDLRQVGIDRDGEHAIYVRILRGTLGDVSDIASYEIIIDTQKPVGSVTLTNPDTNACMPETLWTGIPKIHIGWRSVTDSHLRKATPDTTIDLPDSVGQGCYTISRFYQAWADDHAGNVLRPVKDFCYDGTQPDTSLVDFFLRYSDGMDSVRVCLRFKRNWSESDWATRGVRYAKFMPGTVSQTVLCDSFHSEWNRHEIDPREIVAGDTISWIFQGGIPSTVTLAFLDSSGVISDTMQAHLSSFRLKIAYLYDPTQSQCQDTTLWSNDDDSLGICIDTANSTWQKFNRIEVKFAWAPGYPYDRPRPVRACFKVPLPARPSQCSPSVVTVIGYDDDAGGSAEDNSTIRFDFEEPVVKQGFVDLVDAKGCSSLRGWASNLNLRVKKDSSKFENNCGGVPLSVKIGGDVASPGYRCWRDLDFLTLKGPANSSGERVVQLFGVDSAGNESTVALEEIILYDVDPADSSVLAMKLVDEDSSCLAPRILSGGVAQACFRLTDLDRSNWHVRGIRDYVLLEERRIGEVSCSDYEALNAKQFPRELWDGRWVSDTLRLRNQYEAGDTVWVTSFVRDSSGVISKGLVAYAVYLPKPFVDIRVYDVRDPADSVFVGSDSVHLVCRWGKLTPTDSARLTVTHWCADSAREEVLIDTMVVGPGALMKNVAICVVSNASYFDTVKATLRRISDGQSASTHYGFVVDLQAPTISNACAVSESGARDCKDEIASKEAWMYVRADDRRPGRLKMVRVEAMHVKIGESIVSDWVSFGPNGEAWVSVPLTHPGWWQFRVVAEDSAEHQSTATFRVDCVLSGQAAFCYPNPFKPADGGMLCLSVRSQTEGAAQVQIWDSFGNMVKEWKTGNLRAGRNDGCSGVDGLTWDGSNAVGDLVGSGAYFCRILTPDGREHIVKIGLVR